MKTIKADLAVIGAGSGGLSVASGAAQLGLKVVLFEKGEMGGDCLNTGCVPSKALIAAGKRAQAMRTAAVFGIANAAPQVDWAGVKAHIGQVIETIAPIDSQERFEGLGCTVIREHARFVGPRELQSDSVTVQARRIVVAAGGRASLPAIDGIETVGALTNETIFTAPTFPSRLIVLGAGPIGVELGQAFARLGSTVTIIEPFAPLSRFDPELGAVALEALAGEGVMMKRGSKPIAARKTAAGVAIDLESGETIEGSHLLVAAGRKPNVEGLNLEAAGVAYSSKGIETDDTLRTSNPRVWAVGDIAGRDQLTHAAGWHASVFVRHVLFRAGGRVSSAAMPAAVYCDPELAQIGLSEAQAVERFGAKASVSRWRFEENDRAQAERAPHGLAKLVLGPGGAILGFGVVGEGAGDLIQIAGLAMANGLKARALTAQIAPYPTRGEIVKRTASAHFTPLVFGPRARWLVGLLQRLP
jgi:pyruvate/2-oxoglutarate dehydrogenase complex dihydrolipoamide dehydrogenase (E3) component